MPQYLYPDEDIDLGGGGAQDWRSSPLWSKIDEETPNDADYISAPYNPSAYCILGLTSGVDPGVDTGVKLHIRGGGATGSMSVRLYQGSTAIQTTSVNFTSSSFTTYEVSFAEASIANITDFTDLRIGFEASSTSQTISWAVLELPGVVGTVIGMGCAF